MNNSYDFILKKNWNKKSPERVYHIPFIMLTAKSAIGSQMTIRNLFGQSAKLKERYTRESHIEAMELVHS